MLRRPVVIRGGGDLGSGVALRLWRVGFPIIILEIPHPIAVRRSVALSEAVYEGTMSVEEMPGRLVARAEDVDRCIADGEVAILVDANGLLLPRIDPATLVDAIVAKRNLGTRCDMAPLVVALGPGFTAGEDVHAVVETNRGPHLGRVYWQGGAQPDTGEPGSVGGRTGSRVLRAPRNGATEGLRSIGDVVEEGEAVARVDGEIVRAPFTGLLRGLVRDGLSVTSGMKIGDVDPRLDPDLVTLVSDKALAVAGGVLEAVLMSVRHNRP